MTPCISISRMQILPLEMTSSTALTEVPYMLPENSADSMNSPRATAPSRSGRDT